MFDESNEDDDNHDGKDVEDDEYGDGNSGGRKP